MTAPAPMARRTRCARRVRSSTWSCNRTRGCGLGCDDDPAVGRAAALPYDVHQQYTASHTTTTHVIAVSLGEWGAQRAGHTTTRDTYDVGLPDAGRFLPPRPADLAVAGRRVLACRPVRLPLVPPPPPPPPPMRPPFAAISSRSRARRRGLAAGGASHTLWAVTARSCLPAAYLAALPAFTDECTGSVRYPNPNTWVWR